MNEGRCCSLCFITWYQYQMPACVNKCTQKALMCDVTIWYGATRRGAAQPMTSADLPQEQAHLYHCYLDFLVRAPSTLRGRGLNNATSNPVTPRVQPVYLWRMNSPPPPWTSSKCVNDVTRRKLPLTDQLPFLSPNFGKHGRTSYLIECPFLCDRRKISIYFKFNTEQDSVSASLQRLQNWIDSAHEFTMNGYLYPNEFCEPTLFLLRCPLILQGSTG